MNTPPSTIQSLCPNAKWKRYHNSCYLFHKDKRNWQKSKKYCEARLANLVSVHSDEEFIFIRGNLNSSDINVAWTGGRKVEKTDKWAWDDKTSYNYFNWNVGQPDDESEQPSCIAMHRNYDYQWYDHICSSKYSIICKMKSNF